MNELIGFATNPMSPLMSPLMAATDALFEEAGTPPLTPNMVAAVDAILKQAEAEASPFGGVDAIVERANKRSTPGTCLPRPYVGKILRGQAASDVAGCCERSTGIDVTARRTSESNLCTNAAPPFWVRS